MKVEMIFLSIWALDKVTYLWDKKEMKIHAHTHTPIQPSYLFSQFLLVSRLTKYVAWISFHFFFFFPWCFLYAIVSEIILYAIYLNSSHRWLLSSIFIWKTKTFRFNIYKCMNRHGYQLRTNIKELKTHLGSN